MSLKKFGLDRIEECIKLVKVAKDKKHAVKLLQEFKDLINKKVKEEE